MRETEDPLLDGPVAPPPGALVNEQWQVSPDDPRAAAGHGAIPRPLHPAEAGPAGDRLAGRDSGSGRGRRW